MNLSGFLVTLSEQRGSGGCAKGSTRDCATGSTRGCAKDSTRGCAESCGRGCAGGFARGCFKDLGGGCTGQLRFSWLVEDIHLRGQQLCLHSDCVSML